jgi:hypothetical protein
MPPPPPPPPPPPGPVAGVRVVSNNDSKPSTCEPKGGEERRSVRGPASDSAQPPARRWPAIAVGRRPRAFSPSVLPMVTTSKKPNRLFILSEIGFLFAPDAAISAASGSDVCEFAKAASTCSGLPTPPAAACRPFRAAPPPPHRGPNTAPSAAVTASRWRAASLAPPRAGPARGDCQ